MRTGLEGKRHDRQDSTPSTQRGANYGPRMFRGRMFAATTLGSAGKPKLRLASPSTAGVSEGTRLLKTEKPSYLRNRHGLVFQITDRQACLELLQDVIKCRALFR